ncbi:MAG: DUF368 domain-containing protein [Candidatus Limiplasma sp.]|nr:DUF368 domain-containing protein [Candidatus Limiplasma sp.]
MNWLNQILRGIVIGVANIIPGVSGGTMMVSMGIYDLLIHSITHLFKEFKKSVLTLLPYLIGMGLGILVLSYVLSALLNPVTGYPLPTYTAFIGLILGGLSPLLHKVDKKKVNGLCIALFVLFFALIVVMAIPGSIENAQRLDIDLLQVVILVAVGVIASGTMIIPGVSGSMMLMLLGYYTPVINAVKGLIPALASGNGAAIANSLLTLLPFALGVVLGIFGVAKLIEWLMARYPNPTYCSVLGLVLASPVGILLKNRNALGNVNALIIIISVVTFALGFVSAMLLAKGSKEAPKE